MRTRTATTLALGAMCLLGLGPSCLDPTQVTLHLRTNVPFHDGLTVALTVGRPGAPAATTGAVAKDPWGADGTVGSLVVVPGDDRTQAVAVQAVLGVSRPTGSCDPAAPTGCIVARRRLSYVPHRALRVPITLDVACTGILCREDETCNRLGRCVSAAVNPEACTASTGCFVEGESAQDPLFPDAGAPSEAGPPESGADGGPEAGPETSTRVSIVSMPRTSSHPCVLWSDGRAKCWGRNVEGQLGLGDARDRGAAPGDMGAALPFLDVGAGRTIRSLVTGVDHTCVLLDDGRVKCWGRNTHGQLGVGDTVNRGRAPGELGAAAPPVDLGTAAVDRVLSGFEHNCVLAQGRIRCWGDNFEGQLGLGDDRDRGDAPGELGAALPFADLGPGRSATDLVVGGFHACATLDDATVRCWGQNNSGQLGIGDGLFRGDEPGEMGAALRPLDVGGTVRQLVLGQFHTCALLADGQVKCWGRNLEGQLGYGDTESRGWLPSHLGSQLPPVDLGSGVTVKAIAAGTSYNCALLGDDSVKCWGDNSEGQLGLGDTATRGDGPAEMGNALPRVDLGTGRSARLLGMGYLQTCVVLDDGRVKCWGTNLAGSLGIGDTARRGDAPGEMGDALPAVELGR